MGKIVRSSGKFVTAMNHCLEPGHKVGANFNPSMLRNALFFLMQRARMCPWPMTS